jgi:hypothetical protein
VVASVSGIDPHVPALDETRAPRPELMALSLWVRSSGTGELTGLRGRQAAPYALDAGMDIGFRAGRPEVERALEGHVLATVELMGMFER